MKIITPQDFHSATSGKHILLDTSIFIDAFLHPSEFAEFFNKLKDRNCTLVTIKPVLIEFVKGTTTDKKLDEKKSFVESIIESYLPVTDDIFDNSLDLIEQYRIEGKDLSLTDFILGGVVLKYKRSIYLLTKDISDFPTNIFTMLTYFNLFHRKAIQNIGVYSA
ncbi:MAG: PIN domain-containing protein [Candidatus Levybacteria bacterium]|nr:PIN domain-containing protein [Candidatus Levybacteria bacterium]